MQTQRRLFNLPAQRTGPTTHDLSNWQIDGAKKMRVRALVLPGVTTDELHAAGESDVILVCIEGSTGPSLTPHVWRDCMDCHVGAQSTVRYTMATAYVEGSTTTFHSADNLDSWDVVTKEPFSIHSVRVSFKRGSDPTTELSWDPIATHSGILLELEFCG